MKIWRKWSYLIILLLCGTLTLTVTDSWSGAFEPARQMGIRLAAGDRQPTRGDSQDEASGENGQENGKGGGQQEPSGGDAQTADSQGTANSDAAQADIPGDFGQGDGGEAEQTGAETNEELQDGQGEGTSDGGEPLWRDPSEVVYTEADDSYFSDAVFIGDSRTVGLFEYGGLENITTFYASTGLTVFKLFDSPVVEVPGQKDKITIEQALSERQFAKIYLMIGINEMGRGDLQGFLDKYSEVLEHLKELQPDAIIYLQAIMKVTDERSNRGDYITNAGIEERNQGIAALADNVRVYYLDVNPLICDETGGMEPSYTTDGVHLKAQYIPIWKEFLKQHTVVLD